MANMSELGESISGMTFNYDDFEKTLNTVA